MSPVRRGALPHDQALVSAANDMQIVPMASQTPVWAGASGGGSVVRRDAVGGPATGGTI